VHVSTALTAQFFHILAHILGEVGTFGIVLLSVPSWTCLPIFIEIGSYLINKEQKNKLARFFKETVYM